MIQAKCNKCGGTAFGEDFAKASGNINHAVGLTRGIKCGANYNCVCQIEDTTPKKPTPKTEKPKESTPVEKTNEFIPVEKPKESSKVKKESPKEKRR